jgi:hypothetical protein
MPNLVDPKVKKLAQDFLAEVPGAKPEDVTELAEEIQGRCEDFRRILVNSAHEAGITRPPRFNMFARKEPWFWPVEDADERGSEG